MDETEDTPTFGRGLGSLSMDVTEADVAAVTATESIADESIRYLVNEKKINLRLRKPQDVSVDPEELRRMDEDMMSEKSLGLVYLVEYLDAQYVYNRTRSSECELACDRLVARMRKNLRDQNRSTPKDMKLSADDIKNEVDDNDDVHRLREDQLRYRSRAELIDSQRSACSLLLKQVSRYITFTGQELAAQHLGISNIQRNGAQREQMRNQPLAPMGETSATQPPRTTASTQTAMPRGGYTPPTGPAIPAPSGARPPIRRPLETTTVQPARRAGPATPAAAIVSHPAVHAGTSAVGQRGVRQRPA